MKWLLNKSTGAVEERYDVMAESAFELLRGLDEARKSKPFPFRRCGLCNSVFVRFGKQKFCSKRCTDKAVGSRNKYMCTYMAKRRKNLRDAKKKREGKK